MTSVHTPKPTQAHRIWTVLKENEGQWVNGRVFLREMFLSQYHSRIWELQKQLEAEGSEYTIEASEFKDEFAFKSYRLIKKVEQLSLL